MTTTDWTDDRIKQMTALWLGGVSAAAIARRLGHGVTRSAVLGKLYRLGVARPAASRPQRATTVARPSVRASPDRAPRQSRSAAVLAPAVMAPPLSAQATLLTVRRGDCRWPYGDPGVGDLPMCGRPATRGAYCAAHAGVCYQSRRPDSLFALAGLPEG